MDDFQKECDETVKRIAEELESLYNGNEEGKNLQSYFDDYLDVDYVVNSRKEYRSASICIATGGPGIYIDTKDAMVKLYWGCTRSEAPFSYNVRNKIDSIFEEIYNYT